jgi:hypothetical protein
MVESTSMVNGAAPGPVPACQARASAARLTRSSWRAWPKENERRNVPIVEGAATRWPSTCPVEPARSRSQSSIQLPPASSECTTVIPLSPACARPGTSPRSTWVSSDSRKPSPTARVAGNSSPASATSRSSSKATVISSGL